MYEAYMIIGNDSFKMIYHSRQELYDYLDSQFVHCVDDFEFVVWVHEVYKDVNGNRN